MQWSSTLGQRAAVGQRLGRLGAGSTGDEAAVMSLPGWPLLRIGPMRTAAEDESDAAVTGPCISFSGALDLKLFVKYSKLRNSL